MNPNKRNPHQKTRNLKLSKKEKFEVSNYFSSRNCSLIEYLCLRWRMAIFHYPFTKMKLSASYPLLSLIISFITLTKDHPPHWRQIQKSFQKSWIIKFWCSKEKYWTHPARSENVQTQKKAQARKTKAKKRREKIPAEKGAPKIEKEDRRTKVRSEILHMMILGPITLKTHFGPIILSFVTLSHGLFHI